MRNDKRTPHPAVGKTRTALVVRGDEASTAPLVPALSREGFGSIVACDGGEMIPVLERVGGCDLIVMDSEIQGAAALDLVAYLRHRMPSTPILFISGTDTALLAATARERGVTASLTRPVAPAAAAAAVRAAIRAEWTGVRPAPFGGDSSGRTLVDAGSPRVGRGGAHLWGIVLAGGEGRQLRPLVRRVHGDPRPTQYARLVANCSLLEQTLGRVSLLVPPARTVVSSVRGHRRYLAMTLAGRAETVLSQPVDRGTAAGTILPLLWIARRDQEATVVICPSDHFVLQERRFMAHVADVVAFVNAHPERIVLVGAEPTGHEMEGGAVQPGEVLSRVGLTSISRVVRFVRKPSPLPPWPEVGPLWNTSVVIARASTLIDAARQVLPVVHESLASVLPRLGTPGGVAQLRRAYARLPAENFSTDILERCAPLLAVSRLRGTICGDWGSPRRVIRALRQTGLRPDWLEALTGRQS